MYQFPLILNLFTYDVVLNGSSVYLNMDWENWYVADRNKQMTKEKA